MIRFEPIGPKTKAERKPRPKEVKVKAKTGKAKPTVKAKGRKAHTDGRLTKQHGTGQAKQ